MATNGSSTGSDDYEHDPAARFGEVVEMGAAVWFQMANRWYERAKQKRRWSAEDVVGDCTDLVEHLTPLLEQTIDLTIEAVRPYAGSPAEPAP